jgi:hypothetical protein
MVSFGTAIFETAENSATAGVSFVTRNGECPHGSGVVESVRVLDVSHPAGSWTVRNIGGVTSILQDSGRNLFYVANGDEVWIVSHQQSDTRHECSSSEAIPPMPNCD